MKYIDRETLEYVQEINPRMEISEEIVEGVRFIHFDNFLLRPDEFTQFLQENFPVGASSEWDLDQSPGKRQWIPSIWLLPIEREYKKYVPNGFFNYGTNIYNGDMKSRRHNYLPHTDECANVFTMWLNKECHGGTAFYRSPRFGNDPSARTAYGGGYDFFREFLERPRSVEPWQCFKGDENWEMWHVMEMKYNRVTWYDGWLWHAAYIEPEWYKTGEMDRYALMCVDLNNYD